MILKYSHNHPTPRKMHIIVWCVETGVRISWEEIYNSVRPSLSACCNAREERWYESKDGTRVKVAREEGWHGWYERKCGQYPFSAG